MKAKRLLLGMTLTVACMALLAGTAQAQDAQQDKKVQIKIEKNENGQVIEIDTSFTTTDMVDVDALLRSLGLEGEITGIEEDEEMQIVIKKLKANGDLEDMIIELEGLEELEGLPEKLMEMKEQLHWQMKEMPSADPDRAFLGVYYEPMNPTLAYEAGLPEATYYGAKVQSVIEGTGAEAAGMQPDDIITAIDGKSFTKERSIGDVLTEYNAGDAVVLTVMRGGKSITVNATLGQPKNIREFHWQDDEGSFQFQWDDEDFNSEDFEFKFEGLEDQANKPFLGVYLDYTENAGAVRISGTVDGSTAAEMGLAEGDMITAINGMPVADLKQLKVALDATAVGEETTVTFLRDGVEASATAPIKGKGEHGMIKMHVKEGLDHCTSSLENKIRSEIIIRGDGMSEELMHDLEELRGLEDLHVFFRDEEMEGDEARVVKSVAIFITMNNISEEEIETLNESIADHKLTTTNDLPVEALHFGPNPNDGRFTLNFDLVESGEATIRVYDMNGQAVYESVLSGEPGSYKEVIDISSEPKGTYFLQLFQNGKNFSKKIAIQ